MDPSTAQWLQKLQDGDEHERQRAAEFFAQSDSLPAQAILPLLAACGDKFEATNQWAVAALEDQQEFAADSAMVDGLTRSLIRSSTGKDQNPLVAYWACTLLGRIGAGAQPATPQLLELVQSESTDLSVRERAAWALGKLGKPEQLSKQWDAALQAAADSGQPRLAELAKRAIRT